VNGCVVLDGTINITLDNIPQNMKKDVIVSDKGCLSGTFKSVVVNGAPQCSYSVEYTDKSFSILFNQNSCSQANYTWVIVIVIIVIVLLIAFAILALKFKPLRDIIFPHREIGDEKEDVLSGEDNVNVKMNELKTMIRSAQVDVTNLNNQITDLEKEM